MAAYMIVYARIDDEAGFAPYVGAVGPLIRKYGGRLIRRDLAPQVLEGDWPWGTGGLLEFPSIDAAREFWFSPEYEAVKRLREGVAAFQVILLPEVTPPPAS